MRINKLEWTSERYFDCIVPSLNTPHFAMIRGSDIPIVRVNTHKSAMTATSGKSTISASAAARRMLRDWNSTSEMSSRATHSEFWPSVCKQTQHSCYRLSSHNDVELHTARHLTPHKMFSNSSICRTIKIWYSLPVTAYYWVSFGLLLSYDFLREKFKRNSIVVTMS